VDLPGGNDVLSPELAVERKGSALVREAEVTLVHEISPTMGRDALGAYGKPPRSLWRRRARRPSSPGTGRVRARHS
jgi:hypothetical protein